VALIYKPAHEYCSNIISGEILDLRGVSVSAGWINLVIRCTAHNLWPQNDKHRRKSNRRYETCDMKLKHLW